MALKGMDSQDIELPDNVWEHVIHLLDGVSLTSLSLTSMYFYNLINDVVNWKRKADAISIRYVESVTHVPAEIFADSDCSEQHPNIYRKFFFQYCSVCDLTLLKNQHDLLPFKQNFPKISCSTICCRYLIIGCIDGSVGIFEPKSLHRVKWCQRLHKGYVSSLHCYCRSLFRKFPSTIISTGEDGCVKFLRYDNTYLQVGEPWILPCGSPIVASAKSDKWILLGQQNGDVRLISIRLQGEESSDDGKRRVSANMAALYSDNRRRKVTAVVFYQSVAVVQVEGSSLLVLHIDHGDIPPRLVLSHQIETSILHPSLYMEIELSHLIDYSKQSDLQRMMNKKLDQLRRLEGSVGKLKKVLCFGPILMCLDEQDNLFMLTIEHLHDFIERTIPLEKKALQTSLSENAIGEIGSVCFGYSQNSFIVALTEFGGFNRVATSVFEKS